MKKAVLIIGFLTFCLLLLFFIFCPRIILEKGNITIKLDEEYQEPGYEGKNLFKNLKDEIDITNNINNKKIGQYQVNYKLNYLFYNINKKRIVKVIDDIAPIITLKGNKTVNVCPNKKYEEEGYEGYDNYDGDITSKIKVDYSDNKISYILSDSSNNITKEERALVYEDVSAPVITLKGSSNITIYKGGNYQESGYEVNDNCDDLADSVEVKGSVDINTVGTYTITYDVEDKSGNKSSVNRIVKVIERPKYYGNGKIYLTFDDGPSSNITPYILDILKEENIKATFFVLDHGTSLDYLIKRAYDEGHTIALHSATHDYSYIYSSMNNYFEDLNRISNKVKNIIGIESKIIRFPGGSSNTVSRNYCYGIMSNLTAEVTNRGYHYFDWNIDSDDAGSAYSKEAIYYNVVNNLSYNKTNVVLMHDSSNKQATLAALRDIIKFGKDNGYVFEAITMDTPQVIHGVNN